MKANLWRSWVVVQRLFIAVSRVWELASPVSSRNRRLVAVWPGRLVLLVGGSPGHAYVAGGEKASLWFSKSPAQLRARRRRRPGRRVGDANL